MADFDDFKSTPAAAAKPTVPAKPTAPVKPQAAAPVTPPSPQPTATKSNEPTGIRDWDGEVWPLSTPKGRQLENLALGDGNKPDYTYDVVPTAQWKGTNPLQQNTPEANAPAAQGPAAAQTPAGNGGFYQQGLAPVKAMQQSLINLSRDIASHNIQSVQDRHSKADEASGDLLSGANSFMNFMVTSYMNKAKTTGKQLVNTDVRQPVRMETAKQNDNFKGVLSTIQRIGTPGQEHTPDGDWGPRTNNALQQVYSLAHALMGIVGDMGLKLSGYTDADLAELYGAIPQDIAKVAINEKFEKAGVIAKNLDKLRGLYDSFRETILNNPTYSAHIAQDKPFTVSKTNKTTQNPLTDSEKGLYEQHKATELDVTLNGKKVTVMPYNLSSIDNFKKFLNSKKDSLTPEELAAVNKNDNHTINKFLIEVANGLEQ